MERILCSAIKRKQPCKCVRRYHEQYHDIYECELGWRHMDILHKFDSVIRKDPDAQGFYTSEGRFVSRVEAVKIAKAAGQIDETFSKKILYSEDLY